MRSYRGQPRPQLLPRRRLLAGVPLLAEPAHPAESLRSRWRAGTEAMEPGGDAWRVYRPEGWQAARLRPTLVWRKHGAGDEELGRATGSHTRGGGCRGRRVSAAAAAYRRRGHAADAAWAAPAQ